MLSNRTDLFTADTNRKFCLIAGRHPYKIIDDRSANKATIITSQLPIENWHDAIGDPTLADAILDRLVHNAHQLTLTGESMRKRKNGLTKPKDQE